MHKTMKFEHDKENDAFDLMLGDYEGHEMLWYAGGDWGASSYIMRFPKNKLTLICLSNLGMGNAEHYAFQVLEVLLENKTVDLNN